MATVVSPHLRAAGAAWADGPDAGAWIAERLGPFGPSVGHAVPLGYPAYAIVPIPNLGEDAEEPRPELGVLEGLLAVLERSGRAQRVHTAMWDGWPDWYDTGTDAIAQAATGVGVFWPEGEDPPSREEIERERAAASKLFAAQMIETPDAEPLELPHRRYYVWTGPLRAALAFGHKSQPPPSLIWPEDRSWFVGVPIYTFEIAVAGSTAAIDAVTADPGLGARRATPDDVLEGDD